jgi:hypothetical protein
MRLLVVFEKRGFHLGEDTVVMEALEAVGGATCVAGEAWEECLGGEARRGGRAAGVIKALALQLVTFVFACGLVNVSGPGVRCMCRGSFATVCVVVSVVGPFTAGKYP